jgi:hypothetical protein
MQTRKHILRVYENKVYCGKRGPKTEVTGGWIKLYNEEFYNFWSIRNIIGMRWMDM